MKHTILCAQNAIQCAYENNSSNVESNKYTTQNYYEIANMYIDESIVTCICEYEHATQIENELRELYRFAHLINFEFRATYIESIDVYHLIYALTYDDNERQITSMIVRFNDFQNKSTFENFKTFDLIHDIEI